MFLKLKKQNIRLRIFLATIGLILITGCLNADSISLSQLGSTKVDTNSGAVVDTTSALDLSSGVWDNASTPWDQSKWDN